MSFGQDEGCSVDKAVIRDLFLVVKAFVCMPRQCRRSSAKVFEVHDLMGINFLTAASKDKGQETRFNELEIGSC